MASKHLIREARKRAGFTQKELARRLGTHQPAIARWESGADEPSLSSLKRIVRECDLELNFSLSKADNHDSGLIDRQLLLSPEERLNYLEKFIEFREEIQGAAKKSNAQGA